MTRRLGLWSAGFRSAGFTLVELLIVMAIIGLLVSLSVPAVQASREAARRTQCTNNQRQLGVAFLNFESRNKAYPSSFTCRMTGPLASDGELQLRSFVSDLLPHLEESAIDAQYKRDAVFCSPQNVAAIGNALAVMVCPSSPREDLVTETNYKPSVRVSASVLALYKGVFSKLDGKYGASFRGAASDYGVPTQAEDGVANLFGYHIEKNDPEGLPSMFPSPFMQKSALRKLTSIVNKSETAEFAVRTKAKQITDGLSHTFMLTEIAGRPQHFQFGARTSAGEPLPSAWADPDAVTFDVRGIQNGDDKCIIQCGNSGENGNTDAEIYSFHSNAVNFLFADGHVASFDSQTNPRLLLALLTPASQDDHEPR